MPGAIRAFSAPEFDSSLREGAFGRHTADSFSRIVTGATGPKPLDSERWMQQATQAANRKEIEVPGLEEDAEGIAIVREELKLLATVETALEVAARAAAVPEETRDDALLLELREEIAIAKPEDMPALLEQMHNLGALRSQRGKGVVGAINRKSPYFGHLRLEEQFQGKPRRRDVLIGAKSYVDASAGVRIVDWRNAPVSRIFYRYQEGDDYEELLGDQLVDGHVLARRSVAIVKGELRRVSSPQGVFVKSPNGTWKRLAVNASRLVTDRKSGDKNTAKLGIGADGELREDKVLPAIAALLDKAQYDLITKPGAGIIAIQGSAGSGKTTVGLHRVAYLATTEPGRFRPDKILVVVPNEALIHYVGRVLPELGVDGVAVTTFKRFAARTVVALFPRLPTAVSEDTPAIVSRAKTHGAMLRGVHSVVAKLVADVEKRLETAMLKWPDGQPVLQAWKATAGKNPEVPEPLDVRLQTLGQWLANKKEIQGISKASELPPVTRTGAESLVGDLRKTARNVVSAWDDVLTSKEGLESWFANEPGFGPFQLNQIHDWCVRQIRLRAEGEIDGEVPSVDLEDHALLLRLWQLLRGPLLDGDEKPIRLSHVFVDEVQDSNPVELRVLLDLAGKEQCVTLAGDVAQRMLDDGDDRGEFSWHALLEELGVPATAIDPLQVSYRSTAEITAFSREVLGDFAHEQEAVAPRNGPPVELFEFASPGEAVAFVADALKQLSLEEPYANVALVARFPQQAQVYFEGLERAEVPGIRRVAKQNFTWEPGFDVTDVRQTKGLEFDEVILLETTASSYPDAPNARHSLYVGATRAAHQLWCVSSEAASPVVQKALIAVDEKRRAKAAK
jgi:DNA helicase-2/ATP-dependent DNA helicase PcrA